MNFKKPNFFILGAPKCGTTSLAYWLSEHPEIYMSPIKEPHYYNSDDNYHLVNSKKEYLKLFNDASNSHKAIGEASVWYLYSKEAVSNIEKDIKGAKYIVMLRNPVEMAESLHQQQLFAGNENIQNFNEAWNSISERKKGNKIPFFCREPTHLFYDDICNTGQQVNQLLKQVDKKRVKIILLDDIKENSQECYKEILNFLGVSITNREDFPVINQATVRKSQFLRTVVKIYIWLKNKIKLPRLNTGLMVKIDKLNQMNKKENLGDKKFYSELYQFFERDIKTLERLTSRDLSKWREEKYA